MMLSPLPLLIIIIGCAAVKACNPDSQTTVPRPLQPLASTTPTTENNRSTSSEEVADTDCNGNPDCNDISEAEDGEGRKGAETYEHIIVSGLPYQRGLSHGRQAKDKILRLIAHYRSSPMMPTWAECLTFVRTNYIQAVDYYYPNALVEMKGIGDGAGVPLEEILILNAKYELFRWKKSGMTTELGVQGQLSNMVPECVALKPPSVNGTRMTLAAGNRRQDGEPIETDESTGAVALSSATKYAHVLLGQNWDTSEESLNNETAILLEVHPHSCEKIKPFVTLTEAGQLGRNGMTSGGFGIIGVGLQSSGDVYLRTSLRGWVPSTILTRMFLEAPTITTGLQRIVHAPKHVSVNMIIASAEDEALNVELTPKEYFVTQVPTDKEFLVHSNHFKSVAFSTHGEIKDGYRGSSSIFRDRRVERYLHNAWPRINESTFQNAFKDLVSYHKSTCEQSKTKNSTGNSNVTRKTTLASVIFNLSQRTLQLSKGPLCKGIYKNYRFKFSQL